MQSRNPSIRRTLPERRRTRRSVKLDVDVRFKSYCFNPGAAATSLWCVSDCGLQFAQVTPCLLLALEEPAVSLLDKESPITFVLSIPADGLLGPGERRSLMDAFADSYGAAGRFSRILSNLERGASGNHDRRSLFERLPEHFGFAAAAQASWIR